MTDVFVLVRLNDDDSIGEIISAHPTHQTAINAERYYWQNVREKHSGVRTQIQRVEFEA